MSWFMMLWATFTTNDAISLKVMNIFNSSSTLTAVRSFQCRRCKRCWSSSSQTSTTEEDFTGNVATDSDKLLSGVN